MPELKWIDRKFSFDFPVELHLEILERLRGTPARVEDRIRDVPAKVLTKRPASGWSLQEHVGHLVSVEALLWARLDDYQAGKADLRAADMSNRRTEDARYNEQPLAHLFSKLRKVRRTSVERLEALEVKAFGTSAFHPRLKVPMRLVDTMYFFAEHDDYHLARITELLRSA